MMIIDDKTGRDFLGEKERKLYIKGINDALIDDDNDGSSLGNLIERANYFSQIEKKECDKDSNKDVAVTTRKRLNRVTGIIETAYTYIAKIPVEITAYDWKKGLEV